MVERFFPLCVVLLPCHLLCLACLPLKIAPKVAMPLTLRTTGPELLTVLV